MTSPPRPALFAGAVLAVFFNFTLGRIALFLAPHRAQATHENGKESLIFFFGAVLAAKLAGVDASLALTLVRTHIAARVAFTVIYLKFVRSAPFACVFCVSLVVLIVLHTAAAWSDEGLLASDCVHDWIR